MTHIASTSSATTSALLVRTNPASSREVDEDCKAIHLPMFNPKRIHDAVQDAIQKYRDKTRSPNTAYKIGQAFLSKARFVEPRFHQRDEALNHIPFFHATFETEIASSADIQKLPLNKKLAESTRLVAKRFIDSQTGKSIFTDASVGKANPPLHMQELTVREVRALAATATIDRYAGTYIHKLYKHVLSQINLSDGERLPVKIHLIRPARAPYADDCTVNFLSLAAQREVTQSLNNLARLEGKDAFVQFTDDKNLTVLSRTARSNASPIGRLVQQGYFDTSEIKPGDRVVIVDDHTQAGGTILAMAAAMTQAGARVLAAATPTTHPFCAQLAMSPAVVALLKETLQRWDTQGVVQAKLASLGMGINTLTNHEAMIVIAYATDPDDTVAKQKFIDLENALHGEHRVMEGESDSLVAVLEQKPIPPHEVAKEMDKESASSRQVVAPTPITQLHVLDWDDCLRDEKGMNYQLMHNAIHVAAHHYSSKYPFLESLAQAVEQHRGAYADGKPLLCMNQDEYTLVTVQKNDELTRRDIVKDLLQKLGGLSPRLKQEFDALAPRPDAPSPHKAIENILYQEFLRQYQRLVQPDVEIKRPAAPVNLPFPRVELALKPGAQELLDRIRRPNHFVALISNRQDKDVQKELNKMALMHYFDAVVGVSEVMQPNTRPYKAQLQRVGSKPSPQRLNEIFERHHDLGNASVNLWGDTPKDITQAVPFILEGDIAADRVQGFIVNPSRAIQQQTRDLMNGATLDVKPKVVAADTLLDDSLKPHLE
ncbi:MAG TPA: HAD hydrolase-like protein [Burkholderiaceae bacterium]|nr:HAD hydrolase-like protein [Burkholderiaceae bacterium]